jgi:hypothetical protein
MSPVMYKTYLEICANHSNNIINKMDETVENGLRAIVKYLEEKRYVYTIDAEKLVSVVPRGQLEIDNVSYFCICRKLK